MFHKVQNKLSLICCLTTTLIVLVIILCCLHVSERNMYGQEQALFFLKTNAVSSDLYLSGNIDMNWYRQQMEGGKHLLYLEVNSAPATLSGLLLSENDLAFIQAVQEYLKRQMSRKNERFAHNAQSNTPDTVQQYFEYANEGQKFLVMQATLQKNEQQIAYLFCYNLQNFYNNVGRQRLLFAAIWLFSIVLLYLFARIFTSHALKPVVENDEKQRRFIAFASHELRSPLATLKTGLSMLKNKSDTKKNARIFTLMEREMSGMERLIQDLLYLAKAENAAFRFHFAHVNLADLLTSVYEKHIDNAQNKDVSLSLSVVSGCNYDCLCDGQRIAQAITILVDNAMTYTPSGQTITLHIYSSHRRCYIQVIDTGIGISNADKERIFDRFYQADSSRSQKGHFGLGLSIAREICHTHGGSISVSDTKGGGSTFTIRLPQRQRVHDITI